jgi:hypothetical protein
MNNRYLPFELADMIADYHDYDKYCKPSHKVKYCEVMSDIISMSEIMPYISPYIARECWGKSQDIIEAEYEHHWENLDDYNHYWQHLDNIDYLDEE